jgi:hypothetical protein
MLRILSDEDVPGDIVRGLRQRQPGVDVVRVQEVGLMSVPDPDVLEWAAHAGRQVITRDRSTMTAHATDRVARGLPMPGLFVLPERMLIGQAIAELELLALASEPDEWRGQIIFLPLYS